METAREVAERLSASWSNETPDSDHFLMYISSIRDGNCAKRRSAKDSDLVHLRRKLCCIVEDACSALAILGEGEL